MKPEEISQPAPVTPEPPPPERDPFWGYTDVLMFLGMLLPCFLIAFWLLPKVAGLDPLTHAWQIVPEQLVFYALLLAVLAACFRLQYDRPLLRSLAWVPMKVPPAWPFVAGMLTAIAVSLIGFLIQIPTTENPMTKLLQDPAAVIPIAVFGVTVAPVVEELLFRGFLQPLFRRNVGSAAAIVAANIPFGVLHYREYGNSWRHVVVIMFAGIAFGCMRQWTGSTRASSLMHAAYNGLFFYALFGVKGHH
jgi:membrane protease YdiL (CAAX protease family)